MRRHEEKPIYVGVYYGKQESLSKADIEYEMDLLSEELMEKSSEGYIILAMDGNGKIGLMDGKKSRNGILLMEVFEDAELTVVNGTEKCSGTVTCQNTKKPDEKTAIDFVVCSSEVNDIIEKMIIDEDGLYKIKGSSESDHNSILVTLNLKRLKSSMLERNVTWRLNAPEDKWELFRQKLAASQMNSPTENLLMSEYFANWLKEVENAAFHSIGKTTQRQKNVESESAKMAQLRKERRDVK